MLGSGQAPALLPSWHDCGPASSSVCFCHSRESRHTERAALSLGLRGGQGPILMQAPAGSWCEGPDGGRLGPVPKAPLLSLSLAIVTPLVILHCPHCCPLVARRPCGGAGRVSPACCCSLGPPQVS